MAEVERHASHVALAEFAGPPLCAVSFRAVVHSSAPDICDRRSNVRLARVPFTAELFSARALERLVERGAAAASLAEQSGLATDGRGGTLARSMTSNEERVRRR